MTKPCKYSNLPIGHRMTLDLSKVACIDCGHTSELVVSAEYVGHRVDGIAYDVFRILGSVSCPNCGMAIEAYRDRCYKGGNLLELIGYETKATAVNQKEM